MSCWRLKASCKIGVFLVEPLSDGLMRVAVTKSDNDLSIVAIPPNGLQDCSLPGTFFPQISVVRIQGVGIVSDLTVVALKVCIVLSQIFDFSDEVILVCFGMGLVNASQFACSTSTTNIWSDTITLDKKK